MDETIEYPRVHCVHETLSAILVEGDDFSDLAQGGMWARLNEPRPQAWIPNRAIHPLSEVHRIGDTGLLVVHAWLGRDARGEGLPWTKGGWDVDEDAAPPWWSKEVPRGREVRTPAVLRNRPLKPPGR